MYPYFKFPQFQGSIDFALVPGTLVYILLLSELIICSYNKGCLTTYSDITNWAHISKLYNFYIKSII